MNSPDLINKLAIDSKSINGLHLLSKQDSKKALHEAAKQFEALFLQILVKSMRDATLKSGLFDTHQTRFYTEMYDQQLAQNLSAKGVGLADMMVEQLTRTYNHLEQPLQSDMRHESHDMPSNPNIEVHAHQIKEDAGLPDSNHHSKPELTPETATNLSAPNSDKSTTLWPIHPELESVVEDIELNNSSTTQTSNIATDFINTLLPHASNAAKASGIPAHFMLAQAALESGWGKHEIRYPDSSPSHNLFGIKASDNWKGKTIETVTTEYINGMPQKTVEKFRAYSSYEEGFRDYVNLLSNNPRYANVLSAQNATEFAYGLQQAGYATDPQYANKLMRILNQPSLENQESI